MQFSSYFGKSDQAIGPVAAASVVHQHLVFVLGLEETSLAAHWLHLAIVAPYEILITIIALLQQDRRLVALFVFTIIHLVGWQETVVGPVSVQVDLPVLPWRLQGEMHLRIVGKEIIVDIVAVANIKRTLWRFIVDIAWTGSVRKDMGMKLLPIPLDLLQSHRRMVEVKHLKLAVHIAGRKDELAIVRPLQAIRAHIVGLGVPHRIVPPAVLQDHRPHLSPGIGDTDVGVVEMDAHLLVRLVDVDVGVGSVSDRHLHLRVYHHEARRKQRASIARIVVKDLQTVVAAHFDAAVGIGNRQTIMGVEMVGVERLLVVLYHPIAIEACDKVTVEKSLRDIPVRIAMFYLVNITAILMGHVVEGDVDGIAIQGGDGHGKPVVTRHNLQGADVRIVDDGALGTSAERHG